MPRIKEKSYVTNLLEFFAGGRRVCVNRISMVSTNNDYLSEDLCESVINYTSNISIPDDHRTVLYDLFMKEMTWLNREFNLDYK